MPVPALVAQSPSSGYISWPAFSIAYNGVTYSVGASNTNKRFTWWKYNGGAPTLNSGDALPDGRLQQSRMPNDAFGLADSEEVTGAEWWGVGWNNDLAYSATPYCNVGERVASVNRPGNFAMKLTTTAASAVGSASFGLNGIIPVTPGETISVEAEITNSSGTNVGGVYLRYFDQAGVQRTTMGAESITIANGTTGEIVQRAFTVPAGVTGIIPFVLLHGTTAGSGKTIYVESYKVGRINIQPALTTDDLFLFLNKNGVPASVQKTGVIDGSLVVSESIYADAIAANQITGTHILAGEVDASHIRAGAIQTNHLEAGAITADKLEVNVLASGFTVTGSLQVGTGYWNPLQGLVIPGVASLAPGSASITAGLTALSLTVQKDLLIQGSTNQIKGTLNVANGITTPTVKPTISASWGTIGGRPQPFGAISYGLAQHLTDSTEWVVADSFFGGGMAGVMKADGSANPYPLWTGSKSWQANFYPWGLTSFGSYYWIGGSDSTREGRNYLYKLDTNFEKVAEYAISFYDQDGIYKQQWFNRGRPAVGNDGTNVYVIYANGANAINLNQLIVSSGTWGSIISSLPYSGIGYSNMSACHLGDVGGTSGASFVFTIENLGTYYWNGSAARMTQYDFWKAGSVDIRGLAYDGTKFVSMGIDGIIRYHGTNASAESVTATYSWYDANATNGKHESSVSPVSDTYSRAPRTLVTINTELAPDSGITGTGGVLDDKANMVRVYASKTGSRRLQSGAGTDGALGVDGSGVTIRTLTLDTFNAASVVENASGVASFAGAFNSPGVLQSAGASSSVGWQLSGDGSAKFSGIMGGDVFTSTQAYLGGAGNMSISGTTTVDVTNMTWTITSPGTAAVYELIFSSWMLPASGHTQVNVCTIDGTEQAQVLVMVGNVQGMGTYTGAWRITGLAAGSHTIKVRGRMGAVGQTGGYAGGSNTSGYLKRLA
jgi:hypothetical protein